MFEKAKERINFNPSLFTVVIVFTILLGFLLRLQMLQNFGLNGDSARDVLIAGEAISRREIPLIGPFSSAGPFVTGPIYFWILMVGLVIFPFGISSSWFLFFIIGVITFLLFIYLGYLMGGSRLALVLGIFSATSVSFVNLSLYVSNPVFIIFTTLLTIIFYVLFVHKKKKIYPFLAGLSIGIALNMHYQAVNLLIFLPFIFLVSGLGIKKKTISLFLMILGILIPMMPLLYWDYHQGFANINNILDYFLIAQYRIYVPNSWKIFIFKDMAYFWGNAVGGNSALGLFDMFLIGLTGILVVFRKIKIKQEVVLLAVIFFILLFLNRFYHAQRGETYLLYFLPFVLIFVSLSFNYLFTIFIKNKIKYFLYLIFIIFILGNLSTLRLIFSFQKSNISTYENVLNDLKLLYPNKKFSIYDYKGMHNFASVPLSLVAFERGVQSNDGIKIAVECAPTKECKIRPNRILDMSGYQITDVSTFSENKIINNYKNVNRAAVYDSLIGWSKKNELKSPFSLKSYFQVRFIDKYFSFDLNHKDN